MVLWDQAVYFLRDLMFAYAQATNGNLAAGIVAVTFVARVVLLPFTLHLARSAAVQQTVMRRLKPELDGIRAKFKNDPRRIADETRRIFEREGTSLVPLSGCVGVLLQAPILLALFQAVRQCAEFGGRFTWIRDIAKPDPILAILVAALTVGSVAAGPQPDPTLSNRLVLMVIPGVITLIALWQMAAGVGLYWGVSSGVSVVQGVMVRRWLARTAA